MFQKIPFHRQLADLGVQILELSGIRLRLNTGAATLEDLRRPIEQRLLLLMDHRRVDAEPARQLGNRLFALQGLKGNPRFESGLVLLTFRHS